MVQEQVYCAPPFTPGSSHIICSGSTFLLSMRARLSSPCEEIALQLALCWFLWKRCKHFNQTLKIEKHKKQAINSLAAEPCWCAYDHGKVVWTGVTRWEVRPLLFCRQLFVACLWLVLSERPSLYIFCSKIAFLGLCSGTCSNDSQKKIICCSETKFKIKTWHNKYLDTWALVDCIEFFVSKILNPTAQSCT